MTQVVGDYSINIMLSRRNFIYFSIGNVISMFSRAESYNSFLDGRYLYNLVRIGDYSGNVVQSFAVDYRNNAIFSQHRGGEPEKCYICHYKIHEKGILIADSNMQLDGFGGHQGITIQYFDKNPMLWVSAGININDRGLKAIRFNYHQSKFEVFQFFDCTNFRRSGSTNPCVSLDQKYIIVRGFNKGSKKNIIRVLELSKLKGEGDYSDKYLYQWDIDSISINKKYPLQGIASDGKIVIIQLGFNDNYINKALLIYTISGNLIFKTKNYSIGKWDAIFTGDGKHWEPEGICFSFDKNNNKRLYHCITSGNKGNRLARIYIS
ncbi:hypothetical protein EIM44_10865 [Bibersteinia trehalosi]|uniref:P68 RBP/TagC-like beta-propeller domain-containing protein n=2 Tax=Bibersteinia trehalosi TaxID=47735 RepID=W0R3H0_BIBTR|nr:hypothetical protein [Bibersteinia trehalosi]AHG85694.1 hypothetical protein F544_4620 [Bibersteinia trehalosi USDA-ARS-USMARC-190]RRN00367.1 hypothetical protein EIM44_10865 [Bibersteinia trehalosi]